MSNPTIDLSPRDLAKGTTFVLSTNEWLSIQVFVTGAMLLPTTTALLQKTLPAVPSGGIEQFEPLVKGYKNLYDICDTFDTVTKPDSVKCASNLIAYNVKVPIFYRAILALLLKIEADPTDTVSINQLKQTLQVMINEAQAFSTHATNVAAAMQKFSLDTSVNEAAIGTLFKTYSDKISGTSGTIKTMQAQLAQDKADLADAEDEYKHDIIVAATSASYAWIWPCGSIAAGIVAGIYGDKATKAKARIDALGDLVNSLEAKIAADATLVLDLTRINNDITGITKKIDDALPAIQKIQGMWNALKDDLSSLLATINGEIKDMPSFIAGLGIEAAIVLWQQVADEANAYRINAYITIVPNPTVAFYAADNLERLLTRKNRVSIHQKESALA
ncbi:alpha-xenorhabdolysin family binary toxin subunit A [Mucilaginibacter sp. AW1-7]|jgi:hypothetical protein|uniref:alpha-xenorhabdolysin family binary toxin subunit A n=1 Tax=unclassified Mucilaginibacter TaxID=2617802 RepID=UPI0008B1CF48|nr:alpha-xenorhabdolysin family binary toxin subunit A [Mucilaginibacter sp. OK283]SEO98816.1 haemolytic enterotoxin (HBL) [Mucilaginibacter sp. OK283]